MDPITIVIVVVGVFLVGSAVIYGLYRGLRALDASFADDIEVEVVRDSEEGVTPLPVEPSGPAPADCLLYLFAHEFAREREGEGPLPERKRTFAPLDGTELDTRDTAEQIVFSALVELAAAGCIELRIEPGTPTLMPPFPQKNWTLHGTRVGSFPRGPIFDKLSDVFRERAGRQRRKGEEVDADVPVDELIESAIERLRRESAFWQRAGVYADVRQAVEAHLVDLGYLIPPRAETVLDRLRYRRPTVNERAVLLLRDEADALRRRLVGFREAHPSRLAPPSDLAGEKTIVEGVNAAAMDGTANLDDLGLYDCLRVTVAEAMLAMRSLEPSDDVGI
ncbi:MAG: hypothetical protein ACE5R4_13505 [Armatimonadota bacterium]